MSERVFMDFDKLDAQNDRAIQLMEEQTEFFFDEMLFRIAKSLESEGIYPDNGELLVYVEDELKKRQDEAEKKHEQWLADRMTDINIALGGARV